MKTRIHVNQHNIRANTKGADEPVLTVKDYKQNRKTNNVEIRDSNNDVVATVVYAPEKPLSCGARVWIETDLNVIC